MASKFISNDALLYMYIYIYIYIYIYTHTHICEHRDQNDIKKKSEITFYFKAP